MIEFSEEDIEQERIFIGTLPEGVPHFLIEALADELDADPDTYFERKQRAATIGPVLDQLMNLEGDE